MATTQHSWPRFFDFNNRICAPVSNLPHVLSSPDIFTTDVQQLGVNDDSIVIVYDSLGIFSASRAWWMFTRMAHTQCAVLNGGLPQRQQPGGNIDKPSIQAVAAASSYASSLQRAYGLSNIAVYDGSWAESGQPKLGLLITQ